MKTVRVVFSPEAEEVYNFLNEEAPKSKTERMVLNALNKKIEIINANFHYGNPISKDKIPKEYLEKYGITNLFRIELPNFWRMLYSLTEGDTKIEIIAFVLDVIDRHHCSFSGQFKCACPADASRRTCNQCGFAFYSCHCAPPFDSEFVGGYF